MKLTFFQIYLIGCLVELILITTFYRNDLDKLVDKLQSRDYTYGWESKQFWINGTIIVGVILSWYSVLLLITAPIRKRIKNKQ